VAVIDAEVSVRQYTDSEFKVEWYSGTGAGGQHRNKHQNSCRMTHIETGIVSTAQCRSRLNSQEQARNALIEQLTNLDKSRHRIATSADRKEQVGSGMRGDKIRTYRFQDDIVKDHNSGKSSSVAKVLRGNFDLMW